MHTPNSNRYDNMQYNFCGQSGLQISAISLGLWHNFGPEDDFENCRNMIFTAFDHGINHIDLANNYGPPPGAAETTFGQILKQDLAEYRDELCIATKAGHYMWPGPYGDGGSKKYLISSLNQSLKRMGLDYVDIFYHHRPTPETPMEETAEALEQIVRSGKALYIGISKYYKEDARDMHAILTERNVPCIVEQLRHSMLIHPFKDDDVFDIAQDLGMGIIAFSPLAGGMLTDKYLKGIPDGSRATKSEFLKREQITQELLGKVTKLNDLATKRSQTMAQMALAWVAREPAVTSVLIGASSSQQILDNVAALNNIEFSHDELKLIDQILAE